jgi:hypothetical protein
MGPRATAAPAATGSIDGWPSLEGIILEGLHSQLMEPQLFKAVCEEFHREVNRLRMDENAAAKAALGWLSGGSGSGFA